MCGCEPAVLDETRPLNFQLASDTPQTLGSAALIMESGSDVGNNNMPSQTIAYDPEMVATMIAVLDQAVAALPPDQRGQERKTLIASKILSAAAAGERDPLRLKAAGLTVISDEIPQRWSAAGRT
jgi:hypothetical protein